MLTTVLSAPLTQRLMVKIGSVRSTTEGTPSTFKKDPKLYIQQPFLEHLHLKMWQQAGYNSQSGNYKAQVFIGTRDQ